MSLSCSSSRDGGGSGCFYWSEYFRLNGFDRSDTGVRISCVESLESGDIRFCIDLSRDDWSLYDRIL